MEWIMEFYYRVFLSIIFFVVMWYNFTLTNKVSKRIKTEEKLDTKDCLKSLISSQNLMLFILIILFAMVNSIDIGNLERRVDRLDNSLCKTAELIE